MVSQPSETDAIGRVIGGRYRLVGRVGFGSVGQVYLADDIRLQRRVAIKLLNPSLTDDATFAPQFSLEVQAASNLKHPHIVVVHDWGIADAPYVVSEFLEGGSLATMLDGGHTLSPSQAVSLGIALARGLAYAHARGAVHRRLSPSDVLFGDHARVRIGDFGLARALAGAALTDTGGELDTAVLYAAPEQLLGESTDRAADVYALALILTEAVCGEVPFAHGDLRTVIDARTTKAISPPAELGPLGPIIAGAGHPDPRRRFDAGDVVTALMAVARGLPEPAPLTLVPHILEGVDGTSRRATADRAWGESSAGVAPNDRSLPDITLISSLAMADLERDPVDFGENEFGDDRHGDAAHDESHGVAQTAGRAPSAKSARPAATAGAATLTPPSAAGDVDDQADEHNDGNASNTSRRVLIGALIVAILAGLGGGAWALFGGERVPSHLIPAARGQSVQHVEAELQRLGFVVAHDKARRDNTSAGDLIAIIPAPGTKAKEGSTVTLVVSQGPPLVTLPVDIGGSSAANATSRLAKLGLDPSEPTKQFSETVPVDVVIGYADTTPKQLEKGKPVTFVVSKGPEPRVIPDVSGMSADQAIARLREMKLEPKRAEDYSFDVDTGGLIGLDRATGETVPRGTTVTVIVSKGLLVKVPELGGVVSVSGAIAKLEAVGLRAGAAKGSGKLSGRPVGFAPSSGTAVAKGSTVDIIVE